MLTTTQAAALLGIKSAMARRYCEKGRLAATQVGGRWITTVEAVEAFKATMKKAGRPRKEMRMTQLYGTTDQQVRQLAQFADDDEIWQHANTRTYYVGDAENEDDVFVLIGTVAEYRQELQDLIDAR